MNWPRAPLLVTMSLYRLEIKLRERTARWQFCFLPRLTNLSNSGCTCKQRNCCRNLSAPLVGCVNVIVRRGSVNDFQDSSKNGTNPYLCVDDLTNVAFRVAHHVLQSLGACRLSCDHEQGLTPLLLCRLPT